eukprot:CAMPEP_0171075772 /NCGR_PEP_ID=MMETSP0766_2-20121228/12987_1 /TAXON_ID=439317 /ORGANISM="Gambierdiscus australes, Strain CAWD 149" /LENGTH=286 /DNA_ID=CAMNT_0011532671 /DNA_START=29 /DNA_END=889 /DNA_ORIENTATION=+
MPLADAQGALCRCAVAGKVLIETWPVSSLQVDWSLEAEALDYEPCDVLEVSLIMHDIKLCAGRLQLKELCGQHELELRSASNASMGSVTLHVTPPRVPGHAKPLRTSGCFLCCDVSRSDSRELSFSSWDLKGGVAYTSIVGAPPLPGTLVTHDWAGTFAHLTASVIADALGCSCAGPFQLLEAGEMARLRAQLGAAQKLKAAYWISAFAVNQHACICNEAQRLTDSTGVRIEPCKCSTLKVLSGPACEMDQHSAVRAYLKGLWLDRGKQLAELHVVDPEFPAILEL